MKPPSSKAYVKLAGLGVEPGKVKYYVLYRTQHKFSNINGYDHTTHAIIMCAMITRKLHQFKELLCVDPYNTTGYILIVQVVAVAGRSLERAKEFAGRFSITKAYGSYEQLAQDNDVDIVYVGTIHPTHFDCCMKMFEHNKHILCEKPMTMNANQTRKLIETARSKKLFLMEVSTTFNIIYK